MERKVKVYIDLYPGWHDNPEPFVSASANRPICNLTAGNRRFCIEVSLPCFGGSAETERTIYPPRGAIELVEDRSESANHMDVRQNCRISGAGAQKTTEGEVAP